ncbi:MAG TPA: Fur family transcriptional regulator [Desulfuromonadales bacterium]|nr:Fur family transcriptional regulator [Desulfuromonadales bacterium]
MMPTPAAGKFLNLDHPHQECITAAITAAEKLCQRRGQRLTPLRRRILELIWSGHSPIGAYAILEMLQKEGRAAPPTVYRTLDFLLAQGLIHRIASLNAFAGCSWPGKPHDGQFLICDSCHVLLELDDRKVAAAIEGSAQSADFSIQQQTVEILGRCPRCRQAEE